MTSALHAEWTKLRTTAGAGWLSGLAVALTIGLSAVAAAAVQGFPGQDPTKISLTGVQLGQAIIAILAVLVITGEYSSGLVRTTLTAVPRRWIVLLAKAVVLSAVVLVSGVLAILGSLLAGRFILAHNGFTAIHGYRLLTLADGSTLRAAVGSVLYLVLIALLGLGVATMVRDSAAAVGLVLGLLYLFPVVILVIENPDWRRHLQQIAPTNAGLAVQTTVDLNSLVIGPWAGLGVLAGWAAGALAVAAILLESRDA